MKKLVLVAVMTILGMMTAFGQSTINVEGNVMSLFSSSFESLTTIPSNYALRGLFYGNTYLKDASYMILPATTLTTGAYRRMFQACTSLTTAPELQAKAVPQNGYYYMFYECSSLNYIKCLATSVSASNAVNDWVTNVSASGTFVKDSSMSDWSSGDNGIPNNWTIQNA